MKIIKRNGNTEDFSPEKITKAVEAAFDSVGKQLPEGLIDKICWYITDNNANKVEDIQNLIERVLMDGKFFDVAKSFILYREQHSEARFIQGRLDYMEEYSKTTDNAATSSETDANANVTVKNVANLEGEVYKTMNRRIQRQRMKSKLNVLFPEVAKQYEKDLNHHIIYAHDEASSPTLKAYCMAATLYPLMLDGSGNIDGVTPSAPNDIQSFSGQVTNLVFLLSSQVKGAVAVCDYFIVLNFYVIKEFGSEWYKKVDAITTSEHCLNQKTIKSAIRKGMKQFIYGVNQPAGNRSYNSPFTNVSYYDKNYFNSLFGDFCYPDGTKPEWAAIDKLQRIFMELHRELRLIKPLTFPVSTMALVNDGTDVIDKDYKELCANEWAKGGSFFCYTSDNPSSLASCCFSKDTLVSVIIDKDDIKSMSEIYRIHKDYPDKLIKVDTPLGFKECTPIKLPNRQMYRVITEHDRCMVVSDNHINVTSEGDKITTDLKVGDLLRICTDFQSSAKIDGKFYDKIDSIRLSDYDDDIYCLQMADESYPYFNLCCNIVTHNCRVLNEISDNTFSSTTGMTGVMTGSCNVITLNISRIVQDWACTHTYNGKQFVKGQRLPHNPLTEVGLMNDFKAYLTNILERVYKYQITYKTMLYDMEDRKMFSCSNAGYIYIKKLYSTIGVIGYCEAAKFLKMKVSNNPEYIDFLKMTLGTIKAQNKIHSIHDKKRPFLFNTEAVPAENLAIKLYDWDKADGYYVPEDQNLYNSYFYNPWDDTSVLDKFVLHGKEINKSTDGGQAAHINLDAHLSKKQYLKLIDFAIQQGTNYFTFNIPISECKDCGHVVNAPVKECPVCHSKNIDYWTRVIGYLRPVSSFSAGRQLEQKNRIYGHNIK